MKKLTLYESAMCCSTGVCGPSVDENLIRVTSAMQQVRKLDDVIMVRYNLAQNPNAFVRNEEVSQLLQEKGADCLPITVLDDHIIQSNSYPTNEEINGYLGIQLHEQIMHKIIDLLK